MRIAARAILKARESWIEPAVTIHDKSDSRSTTNRVEQKNRIRLCPPMGCCMEAATKHDWGVVLDRISGAVESALEHVRVQEQELEPAEPDGEGSSENPNGFQQLTDLAGAQEEHLRLIAQQTAECESMLEEQARSLELWRERLQELHARLAEPTGTVPEEHEGDSDVSDP